MTEESRLCRHVTGGHTAILDLDEAVGILVVPAGEDNWVISYETRVTVVGGLSFESVIEHRRYEEGSSQMAEWLRSRGWRFAANDSAAGLPLAAGFTDDGSIVYLLVPEQPAISSGQDEMVG